MLDILIKNGLVADGSGRLAYPCDVAVQDGRIVKLRADINEPAQQVIDAGGLVVAPGFIDCHNHSDGDVFLGSSCYNSLEQGVTTQITGQCGYSPFPYVEGSLQTLHSAVTENEFSAMVERTRTASAFMDAAEAARIGTNMAFFVGHHSLRGKILGSSAAKPTDQQLDAMKADLLDAMEAGCLGFSTGLIYAPSSHADTEELIALAKVMAPYGGIYVSHVRNEADGVADAVQEAIRIGEEAGVQIHISHLKVMRQHNEGTSERLLELIDRANDRGVRVFADQYPYTASSAALNSRIPAQYHAGGRAALLARLRDPAMRREIKMIYTDYDCMYLSYLPVTKQYMNRTVDQIAREEGKAPLDVLCDILVANNGGGQGVYFNQPESDMLRILAHDRVFGGSDSSNFPDERLSPDTEGGRHPRGQAALVRRIAMQRDLALCSMEQSIHRVTGGPAAAFGLTQQGFIREGYAANITVFDYANLRDHATYQYPYRANEGICYVLVNGRLAVCQGRCTGLRAGRILRKGK